MSRHRKIVLFIFIIIIAAATLFLYRQKIPSEISLNEALENGIASVTVRGIDIKEIFLELQSTANTTIVIPAGTLFVSGNSGTQNMMSAQTIRVTFINASPTVPEIHQQNISAYCVNRWLEVPTNLSEFTISGGEDEANPVRRLARCLEGKLGDHYAKQSAIWMVSDDLINFSDEELVETTLNHSEEKFTQLSGEVLARWFEQEYPDTPVEDLEEIRQVSPTELQTRYNMLRPYLRVKILSNIREDRFKAGPLLEECGYDVSKLKLFQTAQTATD